MKTYLISEEALREVLKTQMDMQEGHVELNELLDSIHTLCTILASPPVKPVAWYDPDYELADEAVLDYEYETHCVPLYRKDL